MTAMLFGKKHAAPGRPEALENFRHSLDRVIEEAKYSRLDARVLSEILNARADVLRRSFSVSAPIRSAL